MRKIDSLKKTTRNPTCLAAAAAVSYQQLRETTSSTPRCDSSSLSDSTLQVLEGSREVATCTCSALFRNKNTDESRRRDRFFGGTKSSKMRVAARSLAAALGWRLAASEVCLPRCACNDRAVQIGVSTLCFYRTRSGACRCCRFCPLAQFFFALFFILL